MRLLAPLAALIKRAVLARVGPVDLSRLDKVPQRLAWPLTREVMAPSTRLSALRDKTPMSRLTSFLGIEVWLASGDPEVRELLGAKEGYSNDVRPIMGAAGADGGDFGGLGFTDPPEHTRLRRLLTPEFTMRRLARLQPMIEQVVAGQLDELAGAAAAAPDEPVDLVAHFAFPVPFLVICDLLGVPAERRDHFSTLASARFDVTGGGVGTVGALGGSREFLLEEVGRQRVDPGPGLIGQILRDHGDEITDLDLCGLADGVFTGGLETSASMLALGTATLLERRDLWDRLSSDPTAVGPIVEELLRVLSVVQVAFPRFPQQTVELAGCPVRKGAVVMASLPAANRDPRTTPGDVIDTERASTSHLAFGYGFHRCIGAELARMELRTAFTALAARFPDLTLATPSRELTYHASSIVYGVEAVPVRLGRPTGG